MPIHKTSWTFSIAQIEEGFYRLGWRGRALEDAINKRAEIPNEARLDRLDNHAEKTDTRIYAIEQDLAVIKSNYVPKADILAMRNSLVNWILSAFILSQIVPPILAKFAM